MNKQQAKELAQHMKQAMASRDIGGLQFEGQTHEQYIAENRTWGDTFNETMAVVGVLVQCMVMFPFLLAWEVLKRVNFGVVFVIPIGGRDD